MGIIRPRIRLQSLCIGNSCTARVRASSFIRSKSSCPASTIKCAHRRTEFSSNEKTHDHGDDETRNNNKVMVVVDSSFEAKGALEWALSHTVQSQDTLVLLHVARPNTQGAECSSSDGKFNVKAYQLLLDMKTMCETKRPGVEVSVVMVESEEKGGAIVEEAKQQRVSLLVIGQRKKPLVLWRLVKRIARKKRTTRCGVVDYCIHNSPCITVAVRRKNNKLGGYLITTKRHKNFWLLA